MRWTNNAALAGALIALTGAASPLASAQAVEQVQAGDLQALDGWQLGQAAAGDTALAPTLWQRSDAVAVGALMDKLTGPFPSPAATSLARGVLLSGGAAPAGSASAAGEAARKRFAALGRFGAADEIAAMSAVSPALTNDPGMLMFAAQADLARGRTADACRRVQGTQSTASFVLTLRAFCLAATGQQGAADVALDVARGAGIKDAWLLAAIPAIADGVHGPIGKFDSSFNAAISVAAKLKPPPRAFASSSLLALEVVARSSEAPAALRAVAAQTALRKSAITAAIARDAFAPALAAKPSKTTPAMVATLRAIKAGANAAAKVKVISAALARAPNYTEFVATAQLVHEDIAALPRDASTASVAWALTRANLAIDDVPGAISWRELAVKGAPQSPIGPQRALDCAIVAAGGGDDKAARGAIEQRLQFASPRVARDAVIMGALGLPIPQRADAMVAATPDAKTQTPADPTLLADLADAVRRGAAGETAIAAARIIAPGAHTLDRASVAAVIQALRATQLDGYARQVAVEAMIGAGLE